MKTIYRFILISVIIIFSCQPKKNVVQNNNENYISQLIIDRTFVPDKNPEFNITKAEITNDILSVSISYKGSQRTNFGLFFSGAYKKSLPLQVDLFLKKKEPKNCETKITKEFKFDISNLKRENNNTIVINLRPYTGNLVYNY